MSALHLARVDVPSTGAVSYRIVDDDGLVALCDDVLNRHGDDAVVCVATLSDEQVQSLDELRRVDGSAYRLALHQISSRASPW